MTAINIPEQPDFTKPVPLLRVIQNKPLKTHPWQETIKYLNKNRITRAHNSITNPVYPAPKEGQNPFTNGYIIFTIIGNRVTKEFIYCVKMAQGMHKYRRHTYGAPIIKGVTGLEWPLIYNELKLKYGRSTTVACLSGQVVVLYNNTFLGGEKELKDLIEQRYIYHVALNYLKESIDLFRHFVSSTGRACAYLHISIDDEFIGCLIFMLYSDIAPRTCENFLRLCQTTKGGYSGTPVHRIVEDGWIQCGGFELKDTPLGCENFIVPHDKRGLLGMCNLARGVDCSTQFYVLLQPAHWMNYQYVAIGQLIAGEETLKKIEKVPTFYESPTKNIKILTAGILNLECGDIMVNRGAVAYIDAHTEDLVSLGEMLYEVGKENTAHTAKSVVMENNSILKFQWLMELLALEIHFRYLKRLEAHSSGEGESITDTDSNLPRKRDIENLDSDVEDYKPLFEAEIYRYDQVSLGSAEPKQKRPYYIPLTDVPYPGDTDSNYDVKRPRSISWFLQGDYCLPADLDPKKQKRLYTKKSTIEAAVSSDVYSPMAPIKARLQPSSDFNMDDAEIIDPRNNLEKFCYGGSVVQNIGMKFVKENPLLAPPQEKFNDEELRRIRKALAEYRAGLNTGVPIVKHTQYDVYEDWDVLSIEEEEVDGTRGKHGKKPKRTLFDRDVIRRDIDKTTEKIISGQNIQLKLQHSALDRLYLDLPINSDVENPTLKECRSSINKDLAKFSFLMTSSNVFGIHRPSVDKLITPHIGVTYTKQPRISVEEYKRNNQLYAEKMKKEQANKEKL